MFALVCACASPAEVSPRPPAPAEAEAPAPRATEPPQGLDPAPAREEPGPELHAEPEPAPPPVGCWERTFGAPPSGDGRSFHAPVPDCPDCDKLRAGPLVAGLHVDVVRRLRQLEASLPAPEVDEPVLWVNSGKRDGPPAKSMHNQGLAIDLVVCGSDTRATAQHLRDAGFSCVIEYYDGEGNPCKMAHGDLRGTAPALGAYAPGGGKANTCPQKAVSRGESCGNQAKEDWKYSGGDG